MAISTKAITDVLKAVYAPEMMRRLNADLFGGGEGLTHIDWPMPDRETEPEAFAEYIANRLQGNAFGTYGSINRAEFTLWRANKL